MDPKQCIFGISPFSLSGQNVKLLNIMLYAARLSILHVWLDVHPPTISIWYDKLLSFPPNARLSHVLQATLEDFVKEWSPLSRFFSSDWPAIISIGVN